jgi:2-C-methyl-D-erythritol 2,4-cyclodiphosphate synthase/2-C-methyl-D-erythritol 4-phosphate cytidylyltransferase
VYNDQKVTVIIPAAGTGSRMGIAGNKLLLEIGGITLFEMTLQNFENHHWVDEIVVVTDDLEIERLSKKFSKVKHLVSGGKERSDSIRGAMDTIGDEESIIIVHDAARPNVLKRMIEETVEMASQCGAAIVAVPTIDTIKEVDGSKVGHTLIRDRLVNVQTPQVFKRQLLKEAYQIKTGQVTDDSQLIEQLGREIGIVQGSYDNIKVTTQKDYEYLRFLKGAYGVDQRVGTGFDVHRLIEGRKLIIGGVEIDHTKGLLGHSDADVLIHAIMDALLGAVGKGDIGKCFPDDDSAFSGISSLVLLDKVFDMVTEAGYKIVNIDATILAEKPKMAPHIDQMVKNMSKVLRIELERINVKATTTETLGFVGREEGIAAQAIVMVDKF